jgi:hypothetical protein
VAKRTQMAEDNFWLHKFRATFATRCLWAGFDLRTVQQWPGHSDIESTMRYLKPSRSAGTNEKVQRNFCVKPQAGVEPSRVVFMHSRSDGSPGGEPEDLIFTGARKVGSNRLGRRERHGPRNTPLCDHVWRGTQINSAPEP